VQAAGKMGVLDRLLAKLKGRGHRVTLFSQYNRMLDIIEDYLLMRGYRWVAAEPNLSAAACTCREEGVLRRALRLIACFRLPLSKSATVTS